VTIAATLIENGPDDGDLIVVNAARVSFDKMKTVETFDMARDGRLIEYLARHRHWTPFGHHRLAFRMDLDFGPSYEAALAMTTWAAQSPGVELREVDDYSGKMVIEDSIWGWMTNPPPGMDFEVLEECRRSAPLAYGAILNEPGCPWEDRSADNKAPMLSVVERVPVTSTTLLLECPVFVARQLMRSNVGIVYNEVSRRYVDDAPMFWRPEVWRSRPDGSIKQGSGEGVVQGAEGWAYVVEAYANHAYKRMIDLGVAPEMARTVLPQSMMTKIWMTATAPALERVLGLREDSHAQKEIQDLARAMRKAVTK
jgi:flavin-dependent thymidylate synthase